MKEKIAEGKTKEIWTHNKAGNLVEVRSKDAITAGDGAKKDTIKNKAVWANNTTCSVFKLLRNHGIESHFRERLSDRSFLAYQCEMFPIEVVIRRIATGSYLKRNPEIKDGTIFDKPVVEFFYKDDELHDPYIVVPSLFAGEIDLYKAKQPVDSDSHIKTIDSPCDDLEFRFMNKLAKEAFLVLEKAFNKLNVVLWDLKVEFGKSGEVIYMADVIDNDSWRIRDKNGQQLDKQVYRDGGDLGKVSNLYEMVSKMTSKFSTMEL